MALLGADMDASYVAGLTGAGNTAICPPPRMRRRTRRVDLRVLFVARLEGFERLERVERLERLAFAISKYGLEVIYRRVPALFL